VLSSNRPSSSEVRGARVLVLWIEPRGHEPTGPGEADAANATID
jgi:hypothetical protein